MKHRPSAHEVTKLTEAFDKLLGPRRIIVSLMRQFNNQKFSITCKGDFPFPFQAFIQNIELEVTGQHAGN